MSLLSRWLSIYFVTFNSCIKFPHDHCVFYYVIFNARVDIVCNNQVHIEVQLKADLNYSYDIDYALICVGD